MHKCIKDELLAEHVQNHVSTATAMAMPHSLPPSALINICKASGRVYISLSCKTKSGQKYSFHELMKNRIATAITEGLISGRITRRRMQNNAAQDDKRLGAVKDGRLQQRLRYAAHRLAHQENAHAIRESGQHYTQRVV